MGGGPDAPIPPVSDDDDFVHADVNDSNDAINLNSVSGTSNVDSASTDQVRLIFSKSKVYIHPSALRRDQIPGFICIVERADRDFLLAWIPESLIESKDYEAFVHVETTPPDDDWDISKTVYVSAPPPPSADYASSTPLKDIYSVIVTPPSLSDSWYGSVTVNLASSGISLPTFWFHDDECHSTILQRTGTGSASNSIWGGDELIRWLKKVSNVVQSNLQANLLLVNPSREDVAIHTSPLFDDDAIDQSPETVQSQNHAQERDPFQMDPLISAVKEVRWNIFEKFSQVTRLTRDAAHTVLDSPLARPIRQHLPPPVAQFAQLDQSDNAGGSRPNPVGMMVREYDSARMYLARWAAGLAESAAKERRKEARPEDNAEGWEESTALGVFEALGQDDGVNVNGSRGDIVTRQKWRSCVGAEEKLTETAEEMRMIVFRGGLAPDARREAWPFLLGLYPWDSTEDERKAILESKRDEYHRLKQQWWGNVDESDEYYREQKNRIGTFSAGCSASLLTEILSVEKDVMRTDRTIPFYAGEDRPADPESSAGTNGQGTNEHLEGLKDILMTYNYHNKELGYVQGMSDLLAPIYAVMEDEVAAFWCFCGFMERVQFNFYRDQSGMRRQLMTLNHLIQIMDPQLYKHLEQCDSLNLFFCFRWVLIWFKREFEWNDIQRLWEVLWSDHYSTQFHLFVALSILDRHRSIIIEHLRGFDEILKYVNDLSGTIDLDATLSRAEVLFIKFRRVVETVDNKHAERQANKVKAASAEEGLRKRKQASTSASTSNAADDTEEDAKLPVISEALRELLRNDIRPNAEWRDTLTESTTGLETSRRV